MNLPITITDMSCLAFIYILVRFQPMRRLYIYDAIHATFSVINTLRPRQNGRHFPDDIFKWIFLNENVWISINISLKIVPWGRINNIPTLVQVMAWRRPGDKPLSEPMMARLPTHICVTRPQWVNKDKGKNIRQVLNPRHDIKWLYFNYLHYFIN